MRLSIYIFSLFLVLALFNLKQASAETISMKAQLSPSQARAALNYEPTKGPLESFFPQCAVDKQQASTLNKASGMGTFKFDPTTNKLGFKIKYSGLSGPPIMAHFHNGAPGVSGPILQTICGMPPPTSPIGFSHEAIIYKECLDKTSGVMKGTYTLKDYKCPDKDSSCKSLTIEQQVQLLACGNVYVNLHTCLNQPGEISGQIIPLEWMGKELDCNALPPKGK
ncbi:MAG: CHRD domain-containing protein [Thermodesulfobacteriota bacterium]